jgi:hypothetical protein
MVGREINVKVEKDFSGSGRSLFEVSSRHLPGGIVKKYQSG